MPNEKCSDKCEYGTCNSGGYGDYEGPCGGCCKCLGGCFTDWEAHLEDLPRVKYRWVGTCPCRGQDIACTVNDANWEIDDS